MNKNLSNKNRMFQTVNEVVEAYKSFWKTIPVFVLVMTEYRLLLEKIMTTAQAAGVNLTGVTGSKNNTLDDLGSLLFEICSNLALFAERTKNMALHAKVFLPEYEIKRKKDGDLIIYANEVESIVSQYKASLTDYSIDEADILQLTELIASAKKEMPVPEAQYNDKKSAHADLENQFIATDDFLEKQLDKAVDSLRNKNLAFYNAYYFSRNIKNIGIRHETAKKAEAESSSSGAKTK
jgi:hypothetical protein